jgi:heat shock protein HslJ
MFRRINRLSRWFAWLALAILLAAVAGCQRDDLPGTGPEVIPEDPPDLAGTAWSLRLLNDNEPVEGTQVTLIFEATTAGGDTGCNSYGGDYTTGPGGSLEFGELTQTLILCEEPEGVMEQESAYIETLRQAATYQVVADMLEIQNQAGETTLVFEQQ